MENIKPKPGKRPTPEPDTHTHLIDWLLAHPLIKVRPLEKAAKVPPDTLSRRIRGLDKLPAKHYKSVVRILQQYGYNPPL